MKREGRQHGVVRCYAIPPDPFSRRRHEQIVDSASVSGLFTKVSRKPTNHSKFTGKCGTSRCVGCHILPASKSKDKAKGTMKLRSIGSDLLDVNDYPATSKSAVAYNLANDTSYEDEEIDKYDGEISYHDYDYFEFGIGIALVATNESNIEYEEDEDEKISYCDVGLCWVDGDGNVSGDDVWYLVGHSQ